MLGKAIRGTTVVSVCLLLCGSGAPGLARMTSGDVLLGVTWSDGALVSFDPASGAILQRHVQIDPDRTFTALAWDRNHGKLHALSQDDHALYTLDAATLQIANVVPLRIEAHPPGITEVTSIAYDPLTDTLYAMIGRWEAWPEGPIWGELARVDAWTGDVTILGRIDGPWIASLAFSETERVLYALGVDGAGSWDSSEATRVIRIDPATAAAETAYVTPYHTMLGMAHKEPGTFFSWINGASGFFGQTDVPALSFTPLAGDETSGGMGALLVRTFDLPPEPVANSVVPVGLQFKGRVREVTDPSGRLGASLQAGQLFRGQMNYDARSTFWRGFARRANPYGISLQAGRLAFSAPTYAAAIMNDRLDPADPGPTDEFRLRGYVSSDVVISWTLIDASGNAVQTGDRLPESFDLSRWPINTFTITGYDPCCREPIYRIAGAVDEITPRVAPLLRNQSHSRRRHGN